MNDEERRAALLWDSGEQASSHDPQNRRLQQTATEVARCLRAPALDEAARLSILADAHRLAGGARTPRRLPLPQTTRGRLVWGGAAAITVGAAVGLSLARSRRGSAARRLRPG